MVVVTGAFKQPSMAQYQMSPLYTDSLQEATSDTGPASWCGMMSLQSLEQTYSLIVLEAASAALKCPLSIYMFGLFSEPGMPTLFSP